MKKSEIKEIVAILKQHGDQKFNAFFAAILTSNISIPFYHHQHIDDVWLPIKYSKDIKAVIEQLPNLFLLNYGLQHFFVYTPEGLPSNIKNSEYFLYGKQIKSLAYHIMPLTRFLNNSEDNMLNIQNFIKSLIIKLTNEFYCIKPNTFNIDKTIVENTNWKFFSELSDQLNALFSLLKLIEENADLIPFIKERYEIHHQLLNQ